MKQAIANHRALEKIIAELREITQKTNPGSPGNRLGFETRESSKKALNLVPSGSQLEIYGAATEFQQGAKRPKLE